MAARKMPSEQGKKRTVAGEYITDAVRRLGEEAVAAPKKVDITLMRRMPSDFQKMHKKGDK